ncbi:MAG: putative metallo-hydrolase [Candidatus Celerinatantimonas neptuna]|nr:MAG: putative metallo-hydrolase [Candidatus Celerinatantimonas neptuna]
MLNVHSLFDSNTNTVTHIAYCSQTRDCVVIDPVLDLDPLNWHTQENSARQIVHYVHEHKLNVRGILETHVHADHLTAAPYLKEQLGGQTYIGNQITQVQRLFKGLFNAEPEFATDGHQFDHLLADGDTFELGHLTGHVIHTPGHTPACVSYYIDDAVFVGDTLFMPDYGTARCDFPGGDALTLYHSIQKLYTLPDETRMFLCHDYLPKGRTHYRWETTVGQQKAENIHIRPETTAEEFVQFRTSRDATLSLPKLIVPSVQINMRAGEFPPEEENGTRYLKFPLNRL